MNILLIAWRRPKHLKQVIDAIRLVTPKYVYVAVDGPREGDENLNERGLIEETKKIIENYIDWECELKTLYQEKNLGCRLGVSTAITWFFENVEEGIILEDDCVPSVDFFRFVNEMLVKYRYESKVMHITGNNFNRGKNFNNDSYYFSKYNHMWGWATWKRAWNLYKYDPNEWLIAKESGFLENFLGNSLEAKFWTKYFVEIFEIKNFDTWDYVWRFNCWINGGVTIAPNKNLVTNIGFGNLATHTTVEHKPIPIHELDLQIKHPRKIKINEKADKRTFRIQIAEKYYLKHDLKYRLIRRFLKLLGIKKIYWK
jgi:hypothetical protein